MLEEVGTGSGEIHNILGNVGGACDHRQVRTCGTDFPENRVRFRALATGHYRNVNPGMLGCVQEGEA